MLIRKIRLKNIHSIREETEIDFTRTPLRQCGLFAITGETGAGKTTILDAITLALYGRVCRTSTAGRGDNYQSLSIGAVHGYAECEFETNEGDVYLGQWQVTRRKKRSGEETVDVKRSLAEYNEASGEFEVLTGKIREMEARVEELTGLDFNRFTRSVLLAQGEFAAFIRASLDERSELLEKITGTGIYSEISRAALDRFREEEKKMDDLEVRLASLQLLNSEELEQLLARQKQLKQETNELKSTLEKLQKSLDWVAKLEALTQQKSTAEKELEAISAEAENAGADKRRLEIHYKALPLKAEWVKVERIQQDMAARQSSLGDTEVAIEQADLKLTELNSDLTETKKSLEAHLSDKIAFQETLARVRELDRELGLQKQQLAQLADTEIATKKKLEEKEAQLKRQEKAVAGLEAERKVITEWLSANKKLQSLADKVPLIEAKAASLEELVSKIERANKACKLFEAKRLDLDETLERQLQKMDKLKSGVTAIEEELKQKSDGAYSTDPNDFLDTLTGEVEELLTRKQKLEFLAEKDDRYRKNVNQVQELEAQLQNLFIEEQQLNKTLLSLMDEMEEAGREREYRMKIFLQQQRIASYEKDRAELVEGQACPLCGAEHHPFLEHGIPVYEDQAKEAYEAAEKRVERLKKKEKKLITDMSGVAVQMSGLRNESGTGTLDKLLKEIEMQEREIAAVLGNTPSFFSFSQQRDPLSEELINLEKAARSKKELRDYFREKVKVLNVHNQQLAELEKAVAKSEHELSRVKDQLADAQLWHQEYLEELKNTQTALEELLGKTLTVKPEKLKEELGRLRSSVQEYQTKSKRRDELGHAIEAAKNEIAFHSEECQQLKQTLERITAEKQSAKANYEAGRKERLELFGEKDPDQVLAEWQKKLDRLKESVGKLEMEIASQKQLTKSLTEKASTLKKELAENSAELESLEKALSPKLKELGFERLEDFSEALLDDESLKEIEASLEKLQNRKIKARQDLDTAEKGLQALAASKPEITDKAQLETSLPEIKDRHEKCLQELGGIAEQLRQDAQRRKQAGELEKARKRQQKNLLRWKNLNELIGSHDGKKFRVFAQSLTLQRLVYLANQQLEHLYGRYRIVKREGTDLELNIVDTYQADSVRSLFSLSGGESFLVSLALALGLSNLAARQSHIRSLFIDEGFGSLDEQTLDMAISTLENLQAGGKTIGIISHVKELKERIATQVRVVKKNNGVSRVEISG